MNEAFLQHLKGYGGDLLRAPDPSDVFQSQPRLPCAYQSHNERFVLNEAGVDRQFAQTYYCRFMQLKTSLEDAAQRSWPTTNQSRVVGINNAASEEVYVCGILFKHMKLKPQALDKYLSKKVVEKELQENRSRISDDDFLFLEDNGARIELTGEHIPVHKLVSGICVAVKGRKVANGKFEVVDICYPGLAPQKGFPIRSDRENKHLMFLSGLNFAHNDVDSLLGLHMLSEYVLGATGSSTDVPKNVVRIVICGGLVGKNEELATSPPNSRPQIRALQPLQNADDYLQELARSIPVDVMPGQYDPATFFMPQQSLHKCLLPKAGSHQNLNRITNPYDFDIEGVRILGTSGQNINDILLHTDCENGLMVMERLLKCRHIAPTCPDTLTCFPFDMIDPFVLEETPHILFAGNQSSFQTKQIQESDIATRLICVPDFSLTSKAVFVNLQNLNIECISFESSFNSSSQSSTTRVKKA